MDDKCPGIIQFCRTRVTLLNADGSPASGPDNYYVSEKAVSLAVTSDIEEGQRRTIRSGCGCNVLTHRSSDQLLGYTFELVDGVWEPAMFSLMLGYDALLDEGGTAIIGYNVDADDLSASCGVDQRIVALEAWAYAWDGSGQDADLGAIHFVWPKTKWQVAPTTLSEEATTPTLTGFSERNDNWTNVHGDGPTDGTTAVVPNFFAQFMEAISDLPTASCGLQTVVVTP